MTNLILTTTSISGQIKMTSLDIALLTGKLHKHVMRDIREEIESIGEITEPIFGPSEYIDSTGRKLPCYEFGKAGAMQIALRYDAKTRYKVVKKIEELESGWMTGLLNEEIGVRSLKSNLEIAQIFGLKGNQALLSANTAVKNLHGIDCMATLGITGLISEDKKQYFTPSVLGKKIGLSAVKFNKSLESSGMQVSNRYHKNRLIWQVTNSGKQYCQLLDTNKKHSDGTPIYQIMWSEDVINVLHDDL